MGEIGDLVAVEFEGMSPSRTFRNLVRLNTQYNLAHCLPFIQEGHFVPSKGAILLAGEENHSIKGLVGAMVAVDGENLIQLLRSGEAITDLVEPQFTPTPDYETFARFLIERTSKDGGYAHVDVDGKRATARIQQFGNDGKYIRNVRQELPELIPPDFFMYGRTSPLSLEELGEIGTKTLTAALIARAYSGKIGKSHVNVDVCQIKLTAYGYNLFQNTLGVPRVTRWGEHGFAEDAYFSHIPDLPNDQYVVPEKQIALIHRQYERGSEGVRLVNTDIVTGIGLAGPRQQGPYISDVAPPQYTPPASPVSLSLPSFSNSAQISLL